MWALQRLSSSTNELADSGLCVCISRLDRWPDDSNGGNGSLATLYAAGIVSGLGIGPLTVKGAVSLVEIAVWFSIALLVSLFVSVYCCYGVLIHVSVGRLQYQILWPGLVMALTCALSYLTYGSPRWLNLVGRDDEAAFNLVALRGLDVQHPRAARAGRHRTWD